MKCSDLSADIARCNKGIPVARLFRHYFCEGDHARCPLKARSGTIGRQRRVRMSNNFSEEGIRP